MTFTEIGAELGRTQSTISLEVNRNSGRRGYRRQQADRLAHERHATKAKSMKMSDDVKGIIAGYIRQEWRPEQIAGRLKKDGVVNLHHKTISQYILSDKRTGGDLYTHLRHQNKTYRKRYGSAHSCNGIPNKTDNDERSTAANNRKRVGDWEADTMIGKNHKGVFVTLDERQTKLRLVMPVSSKKAHEVTKAMKIMLNPIKRFVETITFDNGKEFALHEIIAETMK
jgi:IS30 family transposase